MAPSRAVAASIGDACAGPDPSFPWMLLRDHRVVPVRGDARENGTPWGAGSVRRRHNRERTIAMRASDRRTDGRVVLLFGLRRTATADAYARGERRSGGADGPAMRDVVRIGELLRRGYDVITVALGNNDPCGVVVDSTGGWTTTPVPTGAHPQHLTHDFAIAPRKRRRVDAAGGPGLVDDLQRALGRGRTVDYILDEWVFIPLHYGRFHHAHKWEKVLAMAQANLLSPGCRVVVPFHVNAIETLLGVDPVARALWERLIAWFVPSVLPYEAATLAHHHPLWAATQDRAAAAHDRPRSERLAVLVDHDLYRYSVHAQRRHLTVDLRNECGWRDVSPWAAFLVLTLRPWRVRRGVVARPRHIRG